MNPLKSREVYDAGVNCSESHWEERRLDNHVASGGDIGQALDRLIDRIDSLERIIDELHDALRGQQHTKESYSTAEVAEILGKRPYTVREWCRLGRINAFKAMCGRGCEAEWRVPHEELIRFRNEGLLPIPPHY
ncbi:helix-turn-helix domain-containing protein [Aeoliella sp.]|uniref:helix-turn-helix domain-containing protein n=1 Tax=Aeoliella sp. TaxID=2795800 RepID=UPI003CCBD8DA